MKKAIIGCLAILLVASLALTGCELLEGISGVGVNNENTETVSPILSQDGKKLTLVFDGGESARSASRALSSDIAKMGHDFYEVVFNDGTKTFRASWYIGETAAISGLTRATNYYGADKAILMVGRRADRTLLAIGTIAEVDNVAITGTTATITTTTTSVTFAIDSLKGNVSNFAITAPAGSTYTYAQASAVGATTPFNSINYPTFKIPANLNTITATYTLATVTGAAAALWSNGIWTNVPSTFSDGAIIREVRIPNGLGGYINFRSNGYGTKAALTNNITAGALNPVIAFSLDTTSANSGLCAITFSIPVTGINAVKGDVGGTPTTDPIQWNIRPGFGGSQYDLDASDPALTPARESLGGAVLLSVGDGTPELIQINVK